MHLLDPATTALVLIDLQNGIVGMPVVPRTGPETLAACQALATRFREAGAAVVLVRVALAPDFSDWPPGLADRPMPQPDGGFPAGFSTLADGLAHPGDIVVTKRQWGAFTGTELDTLLRRRGVRTLVVAGIATTRGVESTVRHAWELGYHVLVVEDACADPSAAMHQSSITHVFPRIARVTQAAGLGI